MHQPVEPPAPCDHEWELIDDSFDHEFGTEQVFYYRCALCDETREYSGTDSDF